MIHVAFDFMILTTRGRYAVTSLIDIAVCKQTKPVNLTDISIRQNISVGYLEQIFCKLKNAGLVNSIKGPGGGYILAKPLNKINIKQIVDAVEERMEMTKCGNKPENRCLKKSTKCFTHDLWHNLGKKIDEYLCSVSIEDVIENKLELSEHDIF